MDVKAATKTLAAIEQKCDVNSIRFGDLHVWPLIRLGLWVELCHPEKHFLELSSQEAIRHPLTSVAIDIAAHFSRFCRYPRAYMDKVRFHNGRLKDIVHNSDIDMLFFSRRQDHREQIGDKYVNPFLDPLIDLVRGRYNPMKMENDSDLSLRNNQRFEFTVFINAIHYFLKSRIIAKNGNARRIDTLDNFIALKQGVFEVTKGISINKSYFLKQARLAKEFEGFFTEVLSIIRPRVVFLNCYYYPVAMGLISACRKQGIRTVDIQHGKQGKYHGMYTHWTKVPEEGYELLPDFFWVWGEETKENIQRWQPRGLKKNIPVVGGNLWLSQWVHGYYSEEGYGKYRDFFSMLEKYTRTILFTTQPIADPFPDCLLEAMQMSPNTWIWLIRLHPCQKDQAEGIHNFLQERGLDNYEVDTSSEIPLYLLLKKIDHHLTCWSSVCYEANYFDVPTTIIHPTGKDLFEEYIQKGVFSYASNKKGVLATIESVMQKKQLVAEDTPYIETAPSRAHDAIEFILHH